MSGIFNKIFGGGDKKPEKKPAAKKPAAGGAAPAAKKEPKKLVKVTEVNKDATDFDEEARLLAAKVDGLYNTMDAIWTHPTGGGIIYVGDRVGASDLNLLKDRGIKKVVNCTVGNQAIPNYHEDSDEIEYITFPIAHWSLYVGPSDESVLDFCEELFNFVEDGTSQGENVYIHCLAGAHRAGTCGVTCLIHFGVLSVDQAIAEAKSKRPIIDPIGTFPEFLARVHRADLTLRK